MSDIAYTAFTAQIDHNLETAGVSQEALDAAELVAGGGDQVVLLDAIRAMVTDAAGKAQLMFTGSPKGTILRNNVLKATATRAINSAGIPLWNISDDDGNKWDSHEPVLTPEADWVCMYNPETP